MLLTSLADRIASLPKAELHLHLEGSIQPATVCALTARHGVVMTEGEVCQRYAYRGFPEFIEAFKWVTSFLRDPQDYALIARDLAEHLLTQRVVYSEVTLSIGVMILRKQRVEANFEALLRATEPLKAIVAFGIGGDELSVPTKEFRPIYDRAAQIGLHRLMHAGEVGGPEKIREAIELLGAERIGHGIAAIHDPALMDFLAERKIPLEVCPGSNMKTAALARQLRREDVRIEDHPLPKLLRHGIPIVLSTDDPAMFHTTLLEEYANAARMGLQEHELTRIVDMGFEHAFPPCGESHRA